MNPMNNLSSMLWVVLLLVLQPKSSMMAVGEGECTPCYNGKEPFLLDPVRVNDMSYNCTDGVERAKLTTNGTEECQLIQLGTYQGGCCDVPPTNICPLCPDGSQSYNAEKNIPLNQKNYQPYTCDNVATRNQYVREIAEGDDYESCESTPREKARVWCECDGVVPECSLLCNDGNPPPDLTKNDKIFGTTCERYAFDYTGLSADKCNQTQATKQLNFDAKAFCCNEEPPENCDICPEGYTVKDPSKEVKTEFSGTVTCGEIVEYAKYLPGGECKKFINELLDMPERANRECCEKSGGAVAKTSLLLLGLIVTVPSTLLLGFL